MAEQRAEAFVVSDLLEELGMNWLSNAIREDRVPGWLVSVLRNGPGVEGAVPLRINDSFSVDSRGPFRILNCDWRYEPQYGYGHTFDEPAVVTLTIKAIGQNARRVCE